MAQTIKLKRSAIAGRVPTTSDLALGEVAINTVDGKMYIKKDVGGTESIVEIGSGAVSSSFLLHEYSVTTSQTVFSGSDDNSNTLAYDTGAPPRIQVFLNGVLLDYSTDYTATDGTSITLTVAATSGDLIQIAAYKSVTVDSNIFTWIDYATGFSATPTLLQTIADGDVYEYTYSNGTLYRLVPSGSEQDAFYSSFSGGVLSGLVASKGVSI